MTEVINAMKEELRMLGQRTVGSLPSLGLRKSHPGDLGDGLMLIK